MAYKDDVTTISVPVTLDHNKKLYELQKKMNFKSKTHLAKTLMEDAIDNKYKEEMKNKDE